MLSFKFLFPFIYTFLYIPISFNNYMIYEPFVEDYCLRPIIYGERETNAFYFLCFRYRFVLYLVPGFHLSTYCHRYSGKSYNRELWDQYLSFMICNIFGMSFCATRRWRYRLVSRWTFASTVQSILLFKVLFSSLLNVYDYLFIFYMVMSCMKR